MLEGQIVAFVVSNIQFTPQAPCTRPAGEVPSLPASPGDSVWGPWSEIMGETEGPSPKPAAMRSLQRSLGFVPCDIFKANSSGPQHGEKRKRLGTRQPD